MAARKVQCVITGKTYVLTPDYYNKKIQEYSDEETLQKYFLTRKAKTYLERGYSVQEIRNILGVEDTSLPDPNSDSVKDLISYHKIRTNAPAQKMENTLNFATHKSDTDVAAFINNIRTYE